MPWISRERLDALYRTEVRCKVAERAVSEIWSYIISVVHRKSNPCLTRKEMLGIARIGMLTDSENPDYLVGRWSRMSFPLVLNETEDPALWELFLKNPAGMTEQGLREEYGDHPVNPVVRVDLEIAKQIEQAGVEDDSN